MNLNLKNTINRLKDENNNLKNELENTKIIISNLQNQNINNNELEKLKEEIRLKKNIINNLNNELQNEKNKNNPACFRFDDIIVIKFISTNQKINNYPIKCLKTNTFAEIEEKLYKTFNEFRETNNTLLCNGTNILRFKKISDYNLNDGDTIQLEKNE